MTRRRWMVALPLALAVVAAACGSDDSGGSGAAAGNELTGSVVVTGSSTVEPISIAVAEKFNDANPDVDIPVDGPGTGDGFEIFCSGDADINDASSKIKDEQMEACKAGGVEFIELQIANDGLSVMTNTANTKVECLNFTDLYALTGPESQGVKTWQAAEVKAKELGSTTDLPDAALDVVGPGEESGTFSSYVDIVLADTIEARKQKETTRPDYQASPDDNVIIQGVQGSKTSLGWVGYAFAKDAEDVKLLEIAEKPGDECVAPTEATIADGSYPIARPLFIYVNKAKAAENKALAAYVDFYLGDGYSSVGEVKYVPLADDALAETRARWADKTAGAK